MVFQILHDTMEGGILYSEAYLEPGGTSTLELFCENNFRFSVVIELFS